MNPVSRHSSKTIPPTVIAMVGLPARGKSFITSRLTRFLNGAGINTKAFNVGQYRRVATTETSHDFFQPGNKEAQMIRQQCALMAIEDAAKFLEGDGQVAVIDATNTTRQRRKLLMHHFAEERSFHVVFVESICEDPAIIRSNILEAKVLGPDYQGQEDKEMVVQDFMRRIDHYREVYETLGQEEENDYSYMQIIGKGNRFVINKLSGLLQSMVRSYLLSLYDTGTEVCKEQ